MTRLSKINHPDPGVAVGTSSPPAHHEYQGGFVTKLAHKDLALAVNAAAGARVPLQLGQCCEELYRPLAESADWSNKDFSVIYKFLSDSKLDRDAKL